uniref:CW domain-containing protein n=1 Tax=Caenorhabditis tropicalis TaxID=1561998 RepID=A0A1I7UV81_9PELO
MMLIYGEPIGSVQPFQQFDTSWEQCYSDCYDTDNCLIAYYYESQCEFYKFGTLSIKKLSSSVGKLMGIKRYFPEDSCPSKLINDTDIWSISGLVYQNIIEETSESTWNLTYIISKCANDSKLFQRSSDIFLCLGLIAFPDSKPCQDHTQAVSYCKDNNWTSITSPANGEEMTYFQSRFDILIQLDERIQKKNLPEDECPSGLLSSDDIWINDEMGHELSIINSSSSTFTFIYSSWKCDNETGIFRRDTVFVCIGVRPFPSNATCQDYDAAVSLCESDGWSMITLPMNKEELDYLIDEKEKITTAVRYDTYLVWVDGLNGVFDDPTHGGYNKTLICNPTTECAYIGHTVCDGFSPAQ